MSTTWGRFAGSTESFAIEIRLIDDLDHVPSVDQDDSVSWGALRLWANGNNLTNHREADEAVTSLHWYLLPICEWLVENWDALLHEERLPGPEVVDGVSGIERMSQQRLISEDEEDALDDEVRAWWRRHNLAVGASGSILPPTIIRRWGDQVEISVSERPQEAVPRFVAFSGGLVERVGVGAVATALGEMLEALSHELVRRHPGSERLGGLRRSIDALNAPERSAHRLTLLGAPKQIASQLASSMSLEGQAIEASPPIALLFGSLSPAVSAGDVEAVTKFVDALPGQAADLRDQAASNEGLSALQPGPMGSALGDDAWANLADATVRPVDIEGIVEKLGIHVSDIELSDPNVRSICVLSGDRAAMAINPSFAHGEALEVRRFSLAHELCHLLVDRERAVSLAIASGPWAPRDLEQRANAFAAAFLMPSPLVGGLVGESESDDPSDLARLVAARLMVPFTSAVDRLRNLGVLTPSQADRLKDPL